jgi:hypothetical protein
VFHYNRLERLARDKDLSLKGQFNYRIYIHNTLLTYDWVYYSRVLLPDPEHAQNYKNAVWGQCYKTFYGRKFRLFIIN